MAGKRFVILIFILHIAFKGFSQKEFSLQHFSIKDGLSQSTVTNIFQDSKGFIWISTYDGLNRFDGSQFTVYKHNKNDQRSINSRDIYKVFEDPLGRLWIGSSVGLSLYNSKTESFKNYIYVVDQKYSLNLVTGIVDGNSKNEILIGATGGLFLFDIENEKFTHFIVNDRFIEGNSIVLLYKDKRGIIWAAVKGGGLVLYQFENTKLVRLPTPDLNLNELFSKEVLSICEDDENNLWLGTANGVLYKINFNQRMVYSFPLPNGIKDRILSIIQDRSGKLWLGTDSHGIFKFDISTTTYSFFRFKPQPVNKTIMSLYKDRKGDIWIGSHGGGVYLYDELDNRFSFYSPFDELNRPLASNSILSICQDKRGNTWLGTDGGGLIVYSPDWKILKTFTKENSTVIPSNTILSLLLGSDNNIYIGTYLDGLIVYNPERNTSQRYIVKAPQKIGNSDNTIWKIFEDQKHQIWLATNTDGLVRFNPQDHSFKYFVNDVEDAATLSDNSVRAIYQDPTGRMWVGTVYGLNKFDEENEKFTCYHNKLSNDNILCILGISNNKMYLGTLGGGLNVYDMNENDFFQITEKEGLLSNIIYGMEEDGQGNIWLSSDKGLTRYNPATRYYINFNSENGLLSSQFNPGAYFKNPDGQMFFGSNNGLCVFNPNNIKQNQYSPPLYITGLKIFNKPIIPEKGSPLQQTISETDTLVLDYNQNFIAIKYVALNYTHSNNNKYEYKLEPLENDFNSVGNVQVATYTNLDPGEYTFIVKGANNDGYWNETPRKLFIVIKAPFWKQIWFKVAIVLVLLLLVFYWYRMIKRQKIVLEKLVQERTSELQQKNKEIIESEKENARLIQMQLNLELQLKSKELSRTTLVIIQKNKLLEELKQKLKEGIRNPKAMDGDYFRAILRTISLKFNTQKEWKEFDANFDMVHRNLIKTLKSKYPALTDYDLRLCTLFRINVPMKEIADILTISPESLKKARYRLRKKLLLNPEDDLVEFLSNIPNDKK